MTDSLNFPAADPNDPEDVAWNLQTGATMWTRGDQHEAVRWVRRAAEAASDAGSDERALTLARAAADLTNALELPPSMPPPAVATPQPPPATPKPQPVAARPAPPPVTPLSSDEATVPRVVPPARTKAPKSVSDEKTVLDYSIPAGVAEAERKQPPPSRRPPPPTRSSPSAAPPPPPSRSSPSAAPSRPLRSSPSAAPPPVSSPSAAPLSSPSASAGAGRSRQALRVAVTPSPDDKNLLLVRPLGDDEPLPNDAHEALLVSVHSGVHLTSKRR